MNFLKIQIKEIKVNRAHNPDKTALQIYQIVSPLSIPGDRPVRPLAQGPGRSGYINT